MKSTFALLTVVCLALTPMGASQTAKRGARRAAPAPASKCDNQTVSFKRDVLPALQESCLACHYDKKQWPGLDLSETGAYADLVNRKSAMDSAVSLVKPSDPEHSFLVEKISPKPRVGDPMPPYGRGLSPQERKLLLDWIKQGAKNN